MWCKKNKLRLSGPDQTVDSYKLFEANRFVLRVARADQNPTFIEKQPVQRITLHNPALSDKATLVIDKEVKGPIIESTILEVEPISSQ